MRRGKRRDIFTRNEHNPLITARDLPYQANAVFNTGAVDVEDEILLLLRVESCSGRSHLIPARSRDGITDWEIAERALLHPEQDCQYETNGVEDPRITRMEELDLWALAYVAFSDHGPGIALATTKDFRTVERTGLVMPPEDKNPALFPRRFGGLYAMLHRPYAGGSIWISFSPDLVFWGKPELVIPSRGGPWWDGTRVGAGPQPIETEAGWLIIYHGVEIVADRSIYRLGAALLDIENPQRVIGRSRRWLLGPQEPYEQSGNAPNTIFTCGAVVRGNELWIYYGAADCSVCLATAKLSDVLSVIRNEPAD